MLWVSKSMVVVLLVLGLGLCFWAMPQGPNAPRALLDRPGAGPAGPELSASLDRAMAGDATAALATTGGTAMPQLRADLLVPGPTPETAAEPKPTPKPGNRKPHRRARHPPINLTATFQYCHEDAWTAASEPVPVPPPRLQLNASVTVALSPPTPNANVVAMGKAVKGSARLNREWLQVYEGLQRHSLVNVTVLPPDADYDFVAQFDWIVLLTPTTVSLVNFIWIDARLVRRTLIIDFQVRPEGVGAEGQQPWSSYTYHTQAQWLWQGV